MLESSCVAPLALNTRAKMVRFATKPCRTSKCTNTCASHLDELLVKRLRWYQQIARSPELQSVWFACMFGTFGFEHHHTSEHDGSFHRDAHPRVQQFQNDILEQLLRFEDGAVLVSFLDNRPLRIFTDLRQPFIKLDVSAIRLKHFAVCIPPPEYVASPEVSATEEGGEADLEEPSFRCTCLCEDGTPCRATFKSKQQLSVHVRSTQGGTHAVIPDYRKLAITNQCPCCRHVFSSRRTAQQHIRRALCNQQFTGSGSAVVFEPEVPSDIVCPYCSIRFTALSQLWDHVVQHVAGPRRQEQL